MISQNAQTCLLTTISRKLASDISPLSAPTLQTAVEAVPHDSSGASLIVSLHVLFHVREFYIQHHLFPNPKQPWSSPTTLEPWR